MDLTLLHTNDMHDRRTVFPFLESYPRDARTLLVDAGDALRGSNTVFHLHEPILDLMCAVGYDVMAMGNREFNYLRGILRRRQAQIKFPLICANVLDLRGDVHDFWQPTWVREVEGKRVGFVGTTPVMYLDGSPWQKLFGFRFTPPMDVLPGLVAELRPRVDLLVMLSHQGFNTDRRLAEALPGVDVIVGGHSHHLIESPLRVGNTWIVQTGCFGRFVGRMHLGLGEGGAVTLKDYALIPMPGAEPLDDQVRRVA